MQKYEYRPLRAGPDSIRLLQILPGTDDEPLSCQVFQYTLRNKKASALYEALSYVWGSSTDAHKIHIKDAEDADYRYFDITDNLYTALHHLRDPDLPRTFWIDAICINQNDLQERASQVQIMARIYAYALSVSVWLGEEENGSSSVMDMCRSVVAEGLSYSNEWRLTGSKHLERAEGALMLFVSRPWFRRVWVVQEVAVAKAVSVLCGDAELTGAIFTIGLQMALTMLNLKRERPQPIAPVLRLMDKSNASFQVLRKLADLDLSSAVPSFDILPLGQLLEMFQNYEATDRRDRVYALLGLSSDNHISPGMRPDYQRSWSSLFKDVVAHVLGPTANVATWDHREKAAITCMGCPLGTVLIGRTDDEHEITVSSPIYRTAHGPGTYWTATWAVPAYAHKIRDGDLLCFLEGARHPSLLRLCKDHYDIVLISLQPPPGVRIDVHPSTLDLEAQLVPWDNFLQCIPNFPRKVVMIWDWLPDDQRSTDSHDALFDGDLQTTVTLPTAQERLFNTARILDDLQDHANLMALLKPRHSLAESVNMEENHLILLHHACALWNDYSMLKQHIAELRWCYWLLSRNDTSKSLDITDYWASEGFVEHDLFDIVPLLEAEMESQDVVTGDYKPTRWSFDESQFATLLAILSPSYLPPKTRYMSRSLGLETAPHNGRYVMKSFLFEKDFLASPAYETLKRFRDDALFKPRYQLMLAMVSEHSMTGLDWSSAFELATVSRKVDWQTLNFLMAEVADSPASFFRFLESLELDPAAVVFHLFQGQMALLTYYIENLALCELEMALWLSNSVVFESNLRALYDVFEFAPLLARGDPEYRQWGYELSEHRRKRHETYWCRTVSTIRNHSMYSVEALARFARECILDAMGAHIDRCNLNDARSRQTMVDFLSDRGISIV